MAGQYRRWTRFRPSRLFVIVCTAVGLLIALSTLSFIHLSNLASTEADTLARRNEIKMFDNALRDRLMLIARGQLTVARWDDAVANVVRKFDKAFVQREIIDALWYDNSNDQTIIVTGGDTIVALAREAKADFRRQRLSPDSDLARLVHGAVLRHLANRTTLKGGFGQRQVTSWHVDEIAETGFLLLDGRPALVSATAIVPDDDEVTLPDGLPTIIVSAKYIDGEIVRDLNTQLSFEGLTFSLEHDGLHDKARRSITSPSGGWVGTFTWVSAQPGTLIWSSVGTISAILTGSLVFVGLMVIRWIERLARRLEASEAANRHMALHDGLTGLANRIRFHQVLDAAIAELPKRPFAVIACDLDRFKAVNDTYGHAAGDAVIRRVADRLRTVVGGCGTVGRIGGDEFIILVEAYADRPRLAILSHQLIAAVSDPIPLSPGVTPDVGISLGIAIACDGGLSATALTASADRALYAAKERGRGIAVFASDVAPPAGPAASTTGVLQVA